MKSQKGFTLIELMVVIVIIGILSALAIPKMFGTSAKAKAAEVPSVITNWETLQSAYGQEKAAAGTYTEIGFADPSANSKWFSYTDGTTDITAAALTTFGDCTGGDTFVSTYDVAADAATHTATGNCVNYTPNFLP